MESLSKILLVDDDENVRAVAILYLEMMCGDESPLIVEAQDVAQAKEYFNNDNGKFDLVICDFNMPGETGDVFYRFVREHSRTIPYILFSSESNDLIQSKMGGIFNDQKAEFLHKPSQFEDFETAVLLTMQGKDHYYDDEFYDIPLYQFLRFHNCRIDVYLPLGTEKWVKVYNQGDELDHNKMQNYLDKGVRYLSIKSDDAEKFGCQNNYYPIFEALDKMAPNKGAREYFSMCAHVCSDFLLNMNVPQLAVDKAIAAVEEVLKKLEGNNLFNTLFSELPSEGNYILDHSFQLAIVNLIVLGQGEYDTPANREKLVLSSLWHDMALDDDHLAFLHDVHPDQLLEDHNRDTHHNYQKVENHHWLLVQKLSESKLPLGIEGIVVGQHPEWKNPKGEAYVSNNQLVHFFRLSHKYLNKLYRENFSDKAIKEFIIEIDSSRERANASKFLYAFREAFQI
jgi:CheY-like chemotaxis protein